MLTFISFLVIIILDNLITALNNKNDQIKISENRDVEALLNNFDIFKLLLGTFNKEHINKALKKIESKQLKNLNIWLNEHPNYMNNSKEQEEFAKLMSECGKSVEEGREKIIKNLCEKVYLEKIDSNS